MADKECNVENIKESDCNVETNTIEKVEEKESTDNAEKEECALKINVPEEEENECTQSNILNKEEKKELTVETNIIKKVEKAKEFKMKGNDFFKEQLYKKALVQYHSGLMYLKGVECDIRPTTFPFADKRSDLNFTDDELDAIEDVGAELYNNLAACLLKNNPVRNDRVIECCDKVIEKQPDNMKALFRKGQAYYQLEDYTKSKQALRKADKTSQGKDTAVRKLMSLVDAKLKEEEQQCVKILPKNKQSKKISEQEEKN